MTTPEIPAAAPNEPSITIPAPAAPTFPPAQKKAGGLALAALFVGIGAFLFGLLPVFGAMVGLTAVVLGVLALNKQQSKGLAIAGIVLGGIGALSSIGITFGLGAIVSNSGPDKPPVSIVQPSEATPDATEAETEQTAPAVQAPEVPAEYVSALTKAESYSELMHMSKAGIYDQLTSEYGEQFSAEAAQYGIDNVQADWNANALAKAKSYQEQMAMSPESIRDQLTSEYGEKFTAEEADFAIQHLND